MAHLLPGYPGVGGPGDDDVRVVDVQPRLEAGPGPRAALGGREGPRVLVDQLLQFSLRRTRQKIL